MNNTEVWLKEFLRIFRSQYERLSEEDKSNISHLDDFTAPCQMLFLSFKDPNYQYLIAIHDENKENANITIREQIPTHEAIDALDSILHDPRWDKELTEEEKKYLWETANFHKVLERAFLGIIRELRKPPFVNTGSTVITAKIGLTTRSFIWHIQGNLLDLDKVEIVNQIINDTKKRAKAANLAQSLPKPSEPLLRGFGTYFYPPILIGKLPNETFKDRALSLMRFIEKAFDTTYKGKVVVVNSDGFIAICEEEKMKAVGMLNEIMATCLLSGVPLFGAREGEVTGSAVASESLTIASWGVGDFSLRTPLIWGIDSAQQEYFQGEKLKRLISQAEQITQNSETADSLVTLLEAHTCLQSSEYIQSFVMSWMIIEKHIYGLWQNLLRKENMPRNRRYKLSYHQYISVDLILEVLNLAGHLASEDYNAFMELKTKRNEIVHGRKTVSQDEAEKCFHIAERIIQKEVNLDNETVEESPQ